MDFDKWTPEKREIENLDSCYMNFEEMNPQSFGGPQSLPVRREAERPTTYRSGMHLRKKNTLERGCREAVQKQERECAT